MRLSPEELEKVPEELRCNFTGEMDWWEHSTQAKWMSIKCKIKNFFMRPKFLSPEETRKVYEEYTAQH